MCEYVADAFQRLVGTFAVQRTWSNKSAAAGHDPCVPILDQPYVAAAPILDDVTLAGTRTTGVQITNGSSVTFDVKLISDRPTDDWTIKVDDVASIIQQLPAELACTLDRSTAKTGDTAHVTCQRLKDGDGGGSEFVLVSKLDNVTVSLWWGLATNCSRPAHPPRSSRGPARSRTVRAVPSRRCRRAASATPRTASSPA